MKENSNKQFLFDGYNYKIMLIGLVVIIIGFVLMSGGSSDDPNVFSPDIYDFRRIRLAPTVVLIGFAIQVYAIVAKKKEKKTED
ncbi:DUF3098 domain-containing protein [Aureivirga sp. CE67]|uniref:DUF3098 domain-containing protein n=1 Tax=Aureivirga sp. CE67 TaxID=1788983 RepID=UPI0018CAECE5|nr:DUF3098 domain-containing protein [Aureivirga sp. CE67]